MMDGGIGFTHGAGAFFGILFWVVLIILVVFVVRWLSNGGSREPSNRAREILDERYARGEIDQQEYDQKRHEISRKDH